MKVNNSIKAFTIMLVTVLSISFLSACEKKKDNRITEVNLNTEASVFKNHLNDGRVYIVNTQKDYEALLGNLITNLPQINFSKHSFVIVWSGTGCLINKSIDFSTNETNSYDLKINLHLGVCHSVDLWYSAFYIHSKISDNATINLNINEYY
jgi:hypothetical protein